ncbi:MAG: ribosome-associated translation inhibitor RaiA [Bacteroidia bacterium]|nr:ribosome-associated translation inhibitor RaiA [Bacteroidia bacterium]
MKLTIQSIHFDAADHLKEYIQRKTEKLDTFFDRITDGEVFLKLQNEIKGANKLVEMHLRVPGETIIVSKQGATFEEATDLAVDTLKTQVLKYKSKLQAKA